VNSKRQTANNFVGEANGRELVASVVDLQDPNPSAIVDGRKLIEPLLRAWDAFKKLHVHLKAMSWLRLLVTLPAPSVLAVLLVGW